ncbi:Protein ABHD8 [Liparis tanakae]|uniref:Protein ABHD8 n=1 Tax=Liparis tanakae TaxID=230148 RepID=A0A4Z2II46_9TELE|nr:Protein ABHD8 [Liparis tanakae]
MLSGVLEGLLCCLASKSANTVAPAESSEAADGYEFVEVKPGRVLRVRHVVPDRPLLEEPVGPGATVSCKRRITVYRNGQLFIENLAELNAAHNGEAEPRNAAEGQPADRGKVGDPEAVGPAGGEAPAAGGEAPPAVPQPPSRRRRRKPKRTVVIDCERKVSCCRGTHADVALFFIHGVGGSLDIWGRQVDFFSRLGYEVICPDLAGHGASAAPRVAAAYTFYALADDLRLVFKRYARKRNILIGHSYG